ncbi:MarR family winged helix-turn-helix transcriptional regulator [Alkalibacillus aidingensis]|uniref:MarR family winged helix-turn-helix transcriptional regulator n=1 Tax=Alkalibacillus aidingensis TaxID=2747607 RepID=UPI001660D1DC|nr:MarR family transcriptional regulator [Alkalibacillus aidingensis]
MEQLDLIDLISERHLQLRQVSEKIWNDQNNIDLSNSEWIIISKIYHKKQMTVPCIAKHVDISRQAAHKFINRLEEKGVVSVKRLENNRNAKLLELTELGKQCYEKNETLKAHLENRIAEEIGEERLKQFKQVLKEDWGL